MNSINATAATLIGWTLLRPEQRRAIAHLAQQQQDVIRVCAVLSGIYAYHEVEAAIRAAGVEPSDLYHDLAANQPTAALARFYEALGRSS